MADNCGDFPGPVISWVRRMNRLPPAATEPARGTGIVRGFRWVNPCRGPVGDFFYGSVSGGSRRVFVNQFFNAVIGMTYTPSGLGEAALDVPQITQRTEGGLLFFSAAMLFLIDIKFEAADSI